MSAAFTTSGAFTGLRTNLAPYEDTQKSPHTTLSLDPLDLQNPPDEIREMIETFQEGWGALLGAGKRLDFWTTVRMIELFLQTYSNSGIPRSGDRV